MFAAQSPRRPPSRRFRGHDIARDACLARRARCRWHRLAQLRQARQLHQRAVARHAGGARHASAGTREIAAARSGDPLGEGVGLHRRRRRARIRAAHERGAGIRAGARRATHLRSPRIAALPDRRHHPRLRARRRLRARARLPLSRRRQERQVLDRPARGDARHPSGLRRHGARGAPRRRAHGHGDDAHRQDAARRQGEARRLPRPAGLSRRCRSGRARADQSPAQAAHSRRCSIACCPGRWCAAWCKKQLIAQVRAKARPEHYPAPYAIIDLWSKHGARGEAAYEAEARSIAAAHGGRNLAQPGARVHAAGSPQESRRQEQAAARARARGGRGRHGWRHRRLVRAARPQRDAAGSRAQVHRARAASARARPSKSASRTPARPRSS